MQNKDFSELALALYYEGKTKENCACKTNENCVLDLWSLNTKINRTQRKT